MIISSDNFTTLFILDPTKYVGQFPNILENLICFDVRVSLANHGSVKCYQAPFIEKYLNARLTLEKSNPN